MPKIPMLKMCLVVVAVWFGAFPAHAEPVVLQLKWKHQFQFAGYYMAKEMGFYKAAGLDVEIREIQAGNKVYEMLSQGLVDYVVSDSSALIARAEGMPVKALAAIFQYSPLVLFVKQDSDIHHFSDLKGKRVMMESNFNMSIDAALKKAGVLEGDYMRQNISYNIQDLVNDKTDAYAGYLTDQPHQLDLLGFAYRTLTPEAEGVNFYGDILLASDREVRKHPGRVAAFRAASLLGWEYALSHMHEAVDVVFEKYNMRRISHDQLVFEAQKTKEITLSGIVQLGAMSESRWEHISRVYKDSGIPNTDAVLDDFIYAPDQSLWHEIKEHAWELGVLLCVFLLLGALVAVMSLRAAVRKKTASIKEKAGQFRALFEGNKCVELLIDPQDGAIIEANQAAVAFYGYSKEQLLNMRVSDINMLSEQEVKDELNNAYLEKREAFLFRHKLADGSIKHVEVYSGPIYWQDKEALYSIIHDVSKRHEAEYAANILTQATNQSSQAMVITDHDGVVEYVNPAYLQMTGYSKLELEGSFPKILQSEDKAMWHSIFHDAAWQGKVTSKRKDGTSFPSLISVSLIKDKEAKTRHMLILEQDLSEYENLEGQLQQAQKMEAMGTLVGGIAHDFNNILSGVIGNIYLAKKHTDETSPAMLKLKNIERLSYDAANMVEQLLTFARKGHVVMKRLDLSAFLKDSLNLLRTSVPENIEVDYQISNEILFVEADEIQLKQILMNLLNNARDAVKQQTSPHIHVSLQTFVPDKGFLEAKPYFESGTYVHIKVADNGYGIPEENIAHLFDPFFTTKEQGEGTGLGLAMIYGSMKTHEGYVEVESVEGQGSSFHLYFPVSDVILDDANLEHTIEMSPIGCGETILLVDDEPHIRDTIREVLISFGYQVFAAADGAEAVEVFTTHQDCIGLVLMDLVMPKMSGVEAMQRISEMKPNIKVIFATGYDKDSALAEHDHIKRHEIISKPYDVEKLTQRIRKLLR